MPRNGSGTYTRVNSFTAGNTITAAGHNQNWADMETEMTNSVAADGQTTLTGSLKGAAGSVSAPAYAFASDTDSGMYRIGADNVGIAAGGSKIVDVTTTGATVVGTFSATSIQQEGVQIVPAGVVVPYAGSSPPTGWLLCNGQLASRTTYANLFTAIGTTYGAGDGSTTFALPDCTGRAVFGKEASAIRLTTAGSSIDGATLGATGGAQNVTIAQANLPSVTLTGTPQSASQSLSHATSGQSANVVNGSSLPTSIQDTGGGVDVYASNAYGAIDGHTVNFPNYNVPLGGSGTALNKMPPAIVLNYIIKT